MGDSFLIVADVFFLIILVLYLANTIKKIKEENLIDKMTDEETGMGNLRYFKHHFRRSITETTRSLYYVSYIVLDSSYLRSYYGESSFEDVLKYTAEVLSENTEEKEFSARITENGFVIAYRSPGDSVALNRLDRILTKLNNFETVKDKSSKLVFHAAVYRLNQSDKNCELLLFNLRKNCNKIFGTDRQIVHCDIHSMNKIQEEKKMTESILHGLENNEFKMYVQFVVDNKTKKITSCEALSRWESPTQGVVPPGVYISSMESAGLISKHDFYMFDLACRQLEKWRNTKYKDISISCNFTRITISEENFIENLKKISDRYNFDKSKLAIEITEDAMEINRETATSNVHKCKELGFKIYLDDLGSGYTSLSNLCDYPIDVVKIDRDILLKADTPRGKELFSGIVALAHNLSIKVICEGVETDAHNKLVSATECDFVQGWYFSKPLSLEGSEKFIDEYALI